MASIRIAPLGPVFAGLAACFAPQAFECEADADCASGALPGACEASGYCSHEDPACTSGRRYSDLAGGGLAGQCTPDPDEMADTGTSGETSATDAGETDDPTDTGEIPPDQIPPGCGNGMLDPGEGCDDDGPQCNAHCQRSGTLLWEDVYDAGGGDDRAESIAIGPQGSFVVVGSAAGPSDRNALVRRYDVAGGLLSSQLLDFVGNDEAHGVVIDDDRSAVIVGFHGQGGDITAFWAVELDPDGAEAWSMQGVTVPDIKAQLMGVAMRNGQAYAVGRIGFIGNGEAYVSELDRVLGGLAGDHDFVDFGADDAAAAVWIHDSGDLIVGGVADAMGDSRGFLQRRRIGEPEDWTTFVEGTGQGHAGIVAVDGRGDVIVAGGAVLTSANGRDAWYGAFDVDGGLRWQTDFGGAQDDEIAGVAIDDGGHVFVAGNLGRSAWIRKLSPGGDALWTTTDDGSDRSAATDVAIGPDRNIVVSGYRQSAAGDLDVWSARYAY